MTPIILGVRATRPLDNFDAWAVDFRSLYAWVVPAGNAWDGFVGDTCVACNDSLAECIAAIERELLAIRAAIPEPVFSEPAKAQGWVPCSERMPQDMAVTLVLYDDDQMAVAFHAEGEWFEMRADSADGEIPFEGDVTHWMPLPDPPSQPVSDQGEKA